MKAVLNIERPKSLTELVADELRRQIIEGDMELGESLSESRIATQLNVSRTPVREALHRLDIEGLVTTEPQRGTYVFTIDQKQLTNICTVRVTLEMAAIHLALQYDPEGLCNIWEEITKQMSAARATKDDRAYLRLDTTFHQAIFDYTDNPYLNEAYHTISSKMAALRHRLQSDADQLEKSYQQHLQMVEKIKEKNGSGVKSILEEHIGDRKGSYWHKVKENMNS
jgi:DNA-binding GntR family transcriptional regulator